MYDVLRHGTDDSHPAGIFRSETMGLFCSEAISDFLGRFAGDILTVSNTYFWPNELARTLYTQAPDRVIVFRAADVPVIYRPPPASPHLSYPLTQ